MNDEPPPSKPRPHNYSLFPFLLTLTTTAMVAWSMFNAFSYDLPVGNQRVLDVLMGNVMAVWFQSMAFWYGTSFGSSRKNELLAEKEKPTP